MTRMTRQEDYIPETDNNSSSVEDNSKLPVSIKLKALQALDPEGGVKAVNRSSGVLKSICDNNSDDFGGPQGKTPRNHRRQVSNFIDKFKCRNPSPGRQSVARAKIEAEATAATKKKKAPAKAPSTTKKQPPPPQQQPTSPPPIKKLPIDSKMADILSSPLRMIRGSGRKKSKLLLLVCFWNRILFAAYICLTSANPLYTSPRGTLRC